MNTMMKALLTFTFHYFAMEMQSITGFVPHQGRSQRFQQSFHMAAKSNRDRGENNRARALEVLGQVPPIISDARAANKKGNRGGIREKGKQIATGNTSKSQSIIEGSSDKNLNKNEDHNYDDSVRKQKKQAETAELGINGVSPVSDLFYTNGGNRPLKQQQQKELQQSRRQNQKLENDVNNGHTKKRLRNNKRGKKHTIQEQNNKPKSGDKSGNKKDEIGFSKGSIKSYDKLFQELQKQQQKYDNEQKRSSKNIQNTESKKIRRRGSEFLVGGVAINADPPHRAINIKMDTAHTDWAQVITLSVRDFGPLKHTLSSQIVSPLSRGLFCEHFVHNALKWKICPDDLRDMVARGQQKKKQQQYKQLPKISLQQKRLNLKDDEEKKVLAEKKSELQKQWLLEEKGKVGENKNISNQKQTNNSSDNDKNSSNEEDDDEKPFREDPFLADLVSNMIKYGSNGEELARSLNKAQLESLTELKNRSVDNDGGSRAIDEDINYDDDVTKKRRTDSTENANISYVEEQLPPLPPISSLGPTNNQKNNCELSPQNQQVYISTGEQKMTHPPKEDSSTTSNNNSNKNMLNTNSISKEKNTTANQNEINHKTSFDLEGGEVKFTLESVNKQDLENSGCYGESEGYVFRRILTRGISNAIHAHDFGFELKITDLLLTEIDNITEVSVRFHLRSFSRGKKRSSQKLQKVAKELNDVLSEVVENGEMFASIAQSTKQELSWPLDLRQRIADECLLDSNVDTESGEAMEALLSNDKNHSGKNNAGNNRKNNTKGGRRKENNNKAVQAQEHPLLVGDPFSTSGSDDFHPDDLFLGGGNDGIFHDYSEENSSSAPYHGSLGPLLVDSVIERAKQRQPRVIAIGDVHGCIDELQALLRRCDYRPGDMIVFLGDLVSKGPDSTSVVQMAREIGAIGVRGNHDFAVIQWHQAIASGADLPLIRSEHFHIACNLGREDMKWLHNLPWYISSRELSALFVHAGFVSGVRLQKQNPRLMMNMRSILPDGTVTSKFFNNWPWARVWDGPQTVLFGHDADRGLQHYENAIGLDTGCVYGGRLTACILPEKRLVSVNAKQQYFEYRRKHFD